MFFQKFTYLLSFSDHLKLCNLVETNIEIKIKKSLFFSLVRVSPISGVAPPFPEASAPIHGASAPILGATGSDPGTSDTDLRYTSVPSCVFMWYPVGVCWAQIFNKMYSQLTLVYHDKISFRLGHSI